MNLSERKQCPTINQAPSKAKVVGDVFKYNKVTKLVKVPHLMSEEIVLAFVFGTSILVVA